MTKKYSFRCLWIGQSLANCGDVFYIVGLMTVVYAVTKSAIFMTVIPFLTTFIRFISGIFAPLILNKLGLKGSLVRSQIGKSFFLLFMALTLTFHLFGPNFLIMFFFVACISFLDGWASPARNAMVPMLIDQDGLVKANGFLSILDQTINLSGWALGGMLAGSVTHCNSKSVVGQVCGRLFLNHQGCSFVGTFVTFILPEPPVVFYLMPTDKLQTLLYSIFNSRPRLLVNGLNSKFVLFFCMPMQQSDHE